MCGGGESGGGLAQVHPPALHDQEGQEPLHGDQQGMATNKEDILNTLHEDILLEIPPPVPVTSRFLGVSDKHVPLRLRGCFR